METEIVVLCSFQANVDQVADRIGRVPGARGLVIPVGGYALPGASFETSSAEFAAVSDGRASDLSLKRNLALLLARLRGWSKIVFIDDDVSLSPSDVARLVRPARQPPDRRHDVHGVPRQLGVLPRAPAGPPPPGRLRHRRRARGEHRGPSLPFFPDIYNEDWFFFAEAVAHRRLTNVGEARHGALRPLHGATRPHEEFGDLLAEGLYLLLEDIHRTARLRRPGDFFTEIAKLASEKYWSTFIDVRRQDLAETRSRLREFIPRDHCSDSVLTAITSLDAADALYGSHAITAPRCETSCTPGCATWHGGTRSSPVPATGARSSTPWIGWTSGSGNGSASVA